MRKFLITMMCIVMVVCFMPTVAFAETENSEAVINVNPENVQNYLDGEYGPIDGKTIILSAGTYGKLELGRATKYPGSNTDYYIGGIAGENKKTFDEFVAIKNSGQWSASAYYVRNMNNVTIKAAEDANVTVAGIIASSGHVYGECYDYVLDKAYTSGSAYFMTQNLHNITIEGITFTAKAEFATSSSDTVIDGVTFKNCNFNIGSTASGNQALRYYNENNDGKVKNLTVENCEFNNCFQGVYTQKINGIKIANSQFYTTGHNAIAVQSGSGAVDFKSVVITGNTFSNIGDRIIRFGDVNADSQITIKNNTASNSGDSDGQVMKAESLAEGVTYDICGNSWGEGKTVYNSELRDKDAVAAINGLPYTSLQDAIAAATEGQTVTLLKDTSTSSVIIRNGIVLDLGGNILSITGTDNAKWYGLAFINGNSIIQNGTIVDTRVTNESYGWTTILSQGNSSDPSADKTSISLEDVTVKAYYPRSIRKYNTLVMVSYGATANINKGTILKDERDGNVEYDTCGVIGVFAQGPSDTKDYTATCKVNFNGGNINTYGFAICGNGNCHGTSITINSGNVTSYGSSAIYHPQNGLLTMNGGTLTGKTGVQLCSGEGSISTQFEFNGGTVHATGDDERNNKGTGDGLVPDGAAISLINRNYPGGAPSIKINGGIFTSDNSDAVLAYTWSNGQATIWDNANEFLTIKGGRFSSDVSSYKTGDKYCSKESTANDAMYLVHDHNTTCNFGHTYCPGTCKDANGAEMCHTLSHYVAPPTSPTTPTDNVTNSGTAGTDNATTSADLSGSTSTSNGTTTSTVDKTTADKIVDKAVANKSEEIVIDATANSATAANSTTTAQVTIPTVTLGAIAEKTEADVTIKTDVAEVKMDNAAAAAVSEQAEGDTVQIIAEKVAEETDKVEFELKVVCSDGKVISDFKGGNVAVTVALPKAMAEKKLVCVYIDDNGHMSKMEGQKNADGTYTFNTGHFSSYAIMAEEEADAAIAAQKEAIKNIKIKLTSKQVKTKAGKKAVKITWTADAGDKVLDGVEVYRSTERYKGYGTEPFYTSTKGGNTGSYTNTKSLKKGTKYYYRVRGYVLVDGQKVYTDYSTKAWRTVK